MLCHGNGKISDQYTKNLQADLVIGASLHDNMNMTM